MPDADAVHEMRELVDELTETTAALRQLGEREAVPAVERNAARLQGVIEQLDCNLPAELVEE